MKYRIELEKINRKFKAFDKQEYVYGVEEVRTFLNECIEDGYKAIKVVKTTKDGKAYDVTDKYIK